MLKTHHHQRTTTNRNKQQRSHGHKHSQIRMISKTKPVSPHHRNLTTTQQQHSRNFTPEEIEMGQKPIDLHYRLRKASGEATRPPLVILHGLLGHANNWSGIAAKPELSAHRDILTVDLRNHGASQHTEYHDYVGMANDVAHLVQKYTNGTGATIVGHSMGGKVAAATALLHPHLVTGMVLVDILPVTYHDEMRGINTILHTVANCSFSDGAGRREIDQQLAKNIHEVGIRQWLLTNITNLPEKDEHGAVMRWKPNTTSLLQNYENIRGFDLGTSQLWPFHGPSLLLLGGLSSFGHRNTALDVMHEKFPETTLGVIEGAGHWCHSEKPDEFAQKLLSFLDQNNL